MQQSGEGTIQFITEPQFACIEGKELLFFPFVRMSNETEVVEKFAPLLSQDHPMLVQSARANSLLASMVDEWRSKHA